MEISAIDIARLRAVECGMLHWLARSCAELTGAVDAGALDDGLRAWVAKNRIAATLDSV